MKLPALCLLLVSALPHAQSIRPGTSGDLMAEANALFAAPHAVTVTGATLTAGGVTSGCTSAAPEEVQFGIARGFRGVNGFVLSTGWTENGDEENPPTSMTGDPTGCALGTGLVGLPTPACGSVDPTITDSLSSEPPTRDAVSYEVQFDIPLHTMYELSYEFVTYENPSAAGFFDAFAITLDGDLLVGGTSNGGPESGTDPWVLAPSQASPSEFNSQPVNGFFFTPAHSTGMRTVPVQLTAGSHVLSFHVADSGGVVATPSCDEAVDQLVDSHLFVGLHVFQSGAGRALGSTGIGHTPGVRIGRVGHPAPTGGAFPDDLQITIDGVPPGSFLFLCQSGEDSPGVTLPALAPLRFVVALSPFTLLSAQVAGASGSEVWPPIPASVPPTIVGDYHYQWWGLSGNGFFNSNGMKLVF